MGCVELIVSMFPSYRAVLFRIVPKQEKQKNDGLGARYIELLFLEKFKS